MNQRAEIVILMGVAGSGKSTIGKLLAARLGYEFCDSDALHPPANVAKMSSRVPLTDEDRIPWLEAIRGHIVRCISEGESAVIACSALKEKYREFLRVGDEVRMVYLKGDFGLIRDRLAARPGHFMSAEMLQSQFDALEEPDNIFAVDVESPPERIVDLIIENLNRPPAGG
jgi:gluconokinase